MLRIYLLGSLRLFDDGETVQFSALPKTLPLWCYLLLHRDTAVRRDQLAYLLWPDEAESTARSNLRRHLHDLRRALPTAPDETPWLLTNGATLQWNPLAPWWLDVAAYETLLAEGRVTEAAELYAGDLLPTLFEDWIFLERERLRNLFFDHLHSLVQDLRGRRQYAQAITWAQQILQQDPMREDVVRELMEIRHANGDRAGALVEYQRFERRLREELDAPPMVETQALYDAIARQVTPVSSPQNLQLPVLAPVASPTPSGERRPTINLPAQFSSFVGRSEELAAVRALLTSSVAGVRLLTLTGPGGCGKTRLALEAAQRLVQDDPNRFPGGVYFVGLENVTDPALLPQTIAQTLGVHDSGGATTLQNLKEALRSQPMLLILDNFEHVLAAAALVMELLSAAPGLRLIVTSRNILRIYGEQEFPIPPLPLPSEEDILQPDRLSQCESVALFVTRSRAVNPNFVLHRKNAAAVAEICLRLDGLPLALELAAARSKFFPPHALLERLQDRLSFLAERGRVQSERHQTLRATLAWSYNLLNEDEQRLFSYFATFAGSFSIEAATAICGDDDEWNVLSTLESLVNSSLVQQQFIDEAEHEPPLPFADTTDTESSESSFRMLTIVRDYALERLAERADAVVVRRRFVHYYVALAEKAAAQLRGKEQAVWLRRMEREHDNLRSALRQCQVANSLGGEEAELGLRLAAALGIFWFTVGYFAEGERWVEAAMSAAPEASPALRARAFYALSAMLHGQGELRRALPLVEKSLTLFRQIGDQAGIADALYAIGRLLNRQHALVEARQALEESLAISRTLDYDYRVAYVYNILAGIHMAQNELDEAAILYQQALAAARRSQDHSGIAFILTSIGEMARLRGDFAQAETSYQEAMLIAQYLQQKSRIVMLLHNQAQVALHHQQLRKARLLFGDCLRLGQQLPDRENFGMCLVGLGSVAAAQNAWTAATRLLGAGQMVLNSIGADLAPADHVIFERSMQRVREHLSPEEFSAAWQEGYALTFPQAEDLALAQVAGPAS